MKISSRFADAVEAQHLASLPNATNCKYMRYLR